MASWPKNLNVISPCTQPSNLAWDFCDGGFISLAVETAKICLQQFRGRSEKNPRKTNISLKRGMSKGKACIPTTMFEGT